MRPRIGLQYHFGMRQVVSRVAVWGSGLVQASLVRPNNLLLVSYWFVLD